MFGQYLATAMKARSTLTPVLALVSINATPYSCKSKTEKF